MPLSRSGSARLSLTLLIAAGLLSQVSPVFAADAEDAETLPALQVQETRPASWRPAGGVVARTATIGTKTDAPLSETPQSVSVVTREQMEMPQAQSLGEALRYMPGIVTGLANADNRYDQLTIRGFNATTLGLYRDGLRQMSNQMTTRIEPFGLERIEVLRGPASVLYGQAAPGGLVNAVTKRPTADPLHMVEISGGSHDRLQAAVDLGGRLVDDGRALFRLTALARDADTQIDHNRDDRIYVAPALTLSLGEDTSLTLLASRQQDEAGTPGPLPASGTVLPNTHGRIPMNRYSGDPSLNEFDRTQTAFGWAFEHRFDDRWQLRQNTRYDRLDFDQANVYAYTPLATDGTMVNRGAYRFGVDADLFNTDTQLQADWQAGPASVTSLFGLDYRYNAEDFYQFMGAATPIDLYDPVYGQAIANPSLKVSDNTTRIDQIGVYTHQQIRLPQGLVLSLGGRQDWARSRVTDHMDNDARTSRSDDAFTWRAGVAWAFEAGLTPYVSWSTSFSPVSGTDVDGRAFRPSEAEQLEVGTKFQPDGFDSFFTLAWFDLTQTNVVTASPTNPAARYQTGEIRSRGIEFQAVAELGGGIGLIGAYTWQDPEVTRSLGADLHKKPTGIPDHMASLWGDYTVQSGPLTGLGLGAGVRYVGESAGDARNSFTVPDVTLVDLGVRYQLGDWRVAVNASNLFDRYYVAGCSSEANCSLGYERTVVASLRYSW